MALPRFRVLSRGSFFPFVGIAMVAFLDFLTTSIRDSPTISGRPSSCGYNLRCYLVTQSWRGLSQPYLVTNPMGFHFDHNCWTESRAVFVYLLHITTTTSVQACVLCTLLRWMSVITLLLSFSLRSQVHDLSNLCLMKSVSDKFRFTSNFSNRRFTSADIAGSTKTHRRISIHSTR